MYNQGKNHSLSKYFTMIKKIGSLKSIVKEWFKYLNKNKYY